MATSAPHRAPATPEPARGLTLRGALRRIAILSGVLLGLLLAALLVRNERVRRDIDRIGRAGGMVVGVFDPDSTFEVWLEHIPSWVQRWYVICPRYAVFFGRVPMWAGPPIGGSAPLTDTEWDITRPENMEGRVGDPGDEGLRAAASLGRVSLLSLVETTVSDEGLRHLQGMRDLRSLDLGETRVTGPGLAYLRGLPLRWLSLEATPIDDRALAHVAEIASLERLSLMLTRVTGPGLRVLARLPSLEALVLAQTNLGDADLVHLEGFPVRRLVLSDTDVTDAGLDTLGRLPKLEGVQLCGANVTYEPMQRFRKSRNVSVVWQRSECGPFTAPQALRRERRPPR